MKLIIIFLVLSFNVNVFAFDLRGFRATEVTVSADAHHFPYQVGISFHKGFSQYSWCSGSIIDNEWILTAAHCAADAINATVYLGITSGPTNEVIHTVANDDIVIHQDWDSAAGSNDISLIRIPYTSYSDVIQRVKLPSASSLLWNYNGDSAILSELSSSASTVSWTSVHVLPKRVCSRIHGVLMTYNTLCAEMLHRVSGCSSNSGGPLVLELNQVQIGINTFTDEDGCYQSNSAVFTRITDYLDWIDSHTGVSY